MNPVLANEILVTFALLVAASAAVIDYRTGHIPNWLTMGALTVGSVSHLLLGGVQDGWLGVKSAAITILLGMALCSLVPLLLRFVARMGGGDVKLLAALGAVCGPITGFRAETYAFIVMFVYILGRLAYEGKLLNVWLRVIGLVVWRFRQGRRGVPVELMAPLRFGPAILLGTCLATLVKW